MAQAELLQTQAQLVEKEEECRWLSAQLEQAQGGAQVRVATWSQIICALVCVCGLKRGRGIDLQMGAACSGAARAQPTRLV